MDQVTSPPKGTTRLLPKLQKNKLGETSQSHSSLNSRDRPADASPEKYGSVTVDDLKRENASLRIKLHEMQAIVLESTVKNKEGSGAGGKGLESSLVKANAKLYKLEAIIKQKDEKIQQILLEKKVVENTKKEQAKAFERLDNDKNYYLKAGQDLQAELTALKKNTLHGLADEKKALKEQITTLEKKTKGDKDLIHKQLQTIKLLDEKLTEVSKARQQTLNPLYDSNKRNDLYRNKQLADAGAKSELDTITALNLAFSTDEVLEKLLEEQDKELEEEERKKNKDIKDTKDAKGGKDAKDAKGGKDAKDKKGGKEEKGKEEKAKQEEPVEEPPQEKKIVNWEQEYKKLRGVYIDTRFEYEKIDAKIKQEMNLLSKRVNELEDKLREKNKEYDSLNQVLNNKIQSNAERISLRNSTTHAAGSLAKGSPKRTGKGVADMSNVGHEPDNQNSFNEDVKELLKMGAAASSDSIDEKEELRQDRETKKPMDEVKLAPSNASPTKVQELANDGEPVLKLGQFNKESAFDDRAELKKCGAKRIDSITIWADNKSLLGIQVNYETKDGKIYQGPKHLGDVSKDKYEKEPWKIAKGDDIARVRGAVAITHGIIWIEFTTRKGAVIKFGNSEIGKESFDQQFGEDEVPLIVIGSFSSRERGDKPAKSNLSALGFKTIKVEASVQASARDTKVEKADKADQKDSKKVDKKEEDKGDKKEPKEASSGQTKEPTGDKKKVQEDVKDVKKEPKQTGDVQTKEPAGDVKETKKGDKNQEEVKEQQKTKNADRKDSDTDPKKKGESRKASGNEDAGAKKGQPAETKKPQEEKRGSREEKQGAKPAEDKGKAKGAGHK